MPGECNNRIAPPLVVVGGRIDEEESVVATYGSGGKGRMH